METAKLRIVTDTEPPKIIAGTALEDNAPSPITDFVHIAEPVRRARHLDVDAVLERSLPKVVESFEKKAA